MMLCLIAKLDSDATDRLTKLQKTANRFGLYPKALHGHITMATYLPAEEKPFFMVCKSLLRDMPAFSVHYDKVELLSETSILVASPRNTEPLPSLHASLAERFVGCLDRWTCGDEWYPHTTLVYGPDDDLSAILRAMQGRFAPFTACVSHMEFSRVTDKGYEIVEQVTLSEKGS